MPASGSASASGFGTTIGHRAVIGDRTTVREAVSIPADTTVGEPIIFDGSQVDVAPIQDPTAHPTDRP